jgi:uncharacterized protein (TIGR00251 family)
MSKTKGKPESFQGESTESVIIKVRVKLYSKKGEIAGGNGDYIEARLSRPPVDGKANAELIELMAAYLSIQKNRITIEHGHSSRIKMLRVTGCAPDELQKILGGRND